MLLLHTVCRAEPWFDPADLQVKIAVVCSVQMRSSCPAKDIGFGRICLHGDTASCSRSIGSCKPHVKSQAMVHRARDKPAAIDTKLAAGVVLTAVRALSVMVQLGHAHCCTGVDLVMCSLHSIHPASPHRALLLLPGASLPACGKQVSTCGH